VALAFPQKGQAMEKEQITGVLDSLGAPYKKSYGKEKLLEILGKAVHFDTEVLRAACKSRGFNGVFTRGQMLDLIGVEPAPPAPLDEDGEPDPDYVPFVSLRDPEEKSYGGGLVNVVCIVDNVHLGNGDVLRHGDEATLPKELSDILKDKGQVVET